MSRPIQQIIIIGGTIFFAALSLGPLVYVLYVSLLSPALSPQAGSTLSLEHYRTVLTGPALHFPRQLLNSVVVAFISAAGSVMLASLAAYAITRLPLPGRMTILMAVLVAAMFPQIGIVGYLFRMMSALGLINTYPALCLPYVSWTLPISLWILVGYFAKMPRDLDDAARLDGCSHWQTLWKIILPMARPGILSVFLLAFIYAFNEFMFALMLTSDYRARTVSVAIAVFQGAHGQMPWGDITAAAVVTTLPVVLLTILFQRHVVRGLTQGAIKG